MTKVGYNVKRYLSDETRLAVTLLPTEELLQWVRRGGDLLFLCQARVRFSGHSRAAAHMAAVG
ncbi:hypothetical protein HC776_02240 [bacterium]|nr:hypothetical protein [bacterium]